MSREASIDKLYKKIFDVNFLIQNGYYDIQKSNNEIIDIKSVNQYNPKVDTIATDIFNMDDVVNKVDIEELRNIFKKTQNKKIEWSEPIYFSTYKTDITRREYKMPNLYNYLEIVFWMCKNSSYFIKILKKDNNSTSRFFGEFNYKYKTTNELENRILRSGNHILHTDLENFYPSLYTHTIPWLIDGKKVAKGSIKSKKISKAGMIDNLITSCQYGETHGLPTGNLATRIIAELYMCYFDAKIVKDFGDNISFVRYVDDIKFPYTTDVYKNRFLRILRKLCRKYELQLNEDKIYVEAFPYAYPYNKALIFHFFDNYEYINEQFILNANKFIKNLRSKIYEFIDFCVQEENKGNRGAIKSSFAVVTNLVRDLKKNKILSEQGITVLFTKEVSLVNSSLFLKFLEISLKDPRLCNYFIRFSKDIIKLGISSLKLADIVRSYFVDLKQNLRKRIRFYVENDYDQELYQILLYAVYFNVNKVLTKKEILRLINVERDDFTLSLCIILYIKNGWNFTNLIRKMNKLFNDINKMYSNNDILMSQRGWLVRYFFFDLVKNNIIPEKDINKLYKKRAYKKGGKKIILNYRYVLRETNRSINQFYTLLLDRNVHLVSLVKNFNYLP